MIYETPVHAIPSVTLLIQSSTVPIIAEIAATSGGGPEGGVSVVGGGPFGGYGGGGVTGGKIVEVPVWWEADSPEYTLDGLIGGSIVFPGCVLFGIPSPCGMALISVLRDKPVHREHAVISRIIDEAQAHLKAPGLK